MKLLVSDTKSRDEAAAEVAALNLTRKWNVEIKLYRPSRTNEQIRYFYGVICTLLADHTGYSKDEIHDILCAGYFGTQEVKVGRLLIEKPARTLSSPDLLPRHDMSQFFDWCIAFGAQIGVLIPYPNENLEER